MNIKHFTRAATFTSGVFYLLVAVDLFVTPIWFYENVGHFPPFNRHYMGDTAAFSLPLALGLMIAAKDPTRHRLLIGLGALASVLHLLNHAYDAVFLGVTTSHWLVDFTPLVLLAAVLLVAYHETHQPSRQPA